MKIAVLISTYNGEKYIKEQIESVLAQQGDFCVDVFVRDDGSKDSTQSILKSYADNGLIRWYTGGNKGPALSFLDLLVNTKGYDYYAFCDQDDVWNNNKLKIAIDRLKEIKGPVVYFSNAEIVDGCLSKMNKRVYNKQPVTDFKTLCCSGGVLGCTMTFDSKLAEYIQYYSLPNRIIMHDFYVALICRIFNGDVIYDHNSTMLYRQHGNNVVGVSYGFKGKLKNIFDLLSKKEKVSIAEQSGEILHIYGDVIDAEKNKWLNKVANYNKAFINRVMLACSVQLKYNSIKKSIRYRLILLLGNK